MKYIHINCDTGEAPPGADRDKEMAILPWVSAVSIACGGHAGDRVSMRQAVESAERAGCMIGAHPSYPDRSGFGRVEMNIEIDELMGSIDGQLASIMDVCDHAGAAMHFVKPHGALYHRIARGGALASAFGRLIRSRCPGAAIVAPAGSGALSVFASMGIAIHAEGFVDRVYQADGSLRSRSLEGSRIRDAEAAARQAIGLAERSGIVSRDGSILHLGADMLCVHADSPGAVGIARAVHGALRDEGFTIGAAPGDEIRPSGR